LVLDQLPDHQCFRLKEIIQLVQELRQIFVFHQWEDRVALVNYPVFVPPEVVNLIALVSLGLEESDQLGELAEDGVRYVFSRFEKASQAVDQKTVVNPTLSESDGFLLEISSFKLLLSTLGLQHIEFLLPLLNLPFLAHSINLKSPTRLFQVFGFPLSFKKFLSPMLNIIFPLN
jgi:hypothetical protein